MAELNKLAALVGRNIKCYFKDKFLFFVSLLTPMILLLLFATFLRSVYIQSFNGIFKVSGFVLEDGRVLEGLAGSWLLSSILAVSSVTVAICSNAVMVGDKIEGSINDFIITPVKDVTLSLSYFAANFIVTCIIMFATFGVGLVYLAAVGWYLQAKSLLFIALDILCNVLFGSLLAAVIENFISTQGGLSALSSLVSALYGFICGAYMPLSQFADGMRTFICCLPGTYGVGILRNHFMADYISKLKELGLGELGAAGIADGFDCNLHIGGSYNGVSYEGGVQMPIWGMYAILLGACALLLAAYAVVVLIKHKNNK